MKYLFDCLDVRVFKNRHRRIFDKGLCSFWVGTMGSYKIPSRRVNHGLFLRSLSLGASIP